MWASDTKSGDRRSATRRRRKKHDQTQDEQTNDERSSGVRQTGASSGRRSRPRRVPGRTPTPTTTMQPPTTCAGAAPDVVTPPKPPTESECAMAEFVRTTMAKSVEGLRKEFLELKTFVPPDFRHDVFAANETRNRYRDVVCLDASRVPLTLNVPPDSDYIHANWVKLDGLERKYIATQGPLESTTGDFWRMVFQENATSVVMLCRFVEDQKNKCAVYFPEEQGAYKNYGCMFVNNKKVERNEDLQLTTYTLEVLPDGCSNSNLVKLLHFGEWPDRGVPDKPMSVLRLLAVVPAGVCVLHCSAGIGRTGTVLAIDSGIQQLKKGHVVAVKEVVQQLRCQRASAVQTESQYVLIFTCVLEYCRVKRPKEYRQFVLQFVDEVRRAGMV